MLRLILGLIFTVALATSAWASSSVVPVQGVVTSNTVSTATNAAITVTNTGVAGLRWQLRYLGVQLSDAGTCDLTITDGSTVIWRVAAGSLTTYKEFDLPETGIAASAGSNLVIALQACGAASAATLNAVNDLSQ